MEIIKLEIVAIAIGCLFRNGVYASCKSLLIDPIEKGKLLKIIAFFFFFIKGILCCVIWHAGGHSDIAPLAVLQLCIFINEVNINFSMLNLLKKKNQQKLEIENLQYINVAYSEGAKGARELLDDILTYGHDVMHMLNRCWILAGEKLKGLIEEDVQNLIKQNIALQRRAGNVVSNGIARAMREKYEDDTLKINTEFDIPIDDFPIAEKDLAAAMGASLEEMILKCHGIGEAKLITQYDGRFCYVVAYARPTADAQAKKDIDKSERELTQIIKKIAEDYQGMIFGPEMREGDDYYRVKLMLPIGNFR